jgi:hypothetical protein
MPICFAVLLSFSMVLLNCFDEGIRPDEVKIGTYGRLGYPVRMVQIIDAQNAVVTFGDLTMWMHGLSTKDLVDGDLANIKAEIEISRTKQYKTPLGTSKTVYMIEPLSDSTRAKLKAEQESAAKVENAARAKRLQAAEKAAAEIQVAKEKKQSAAKIASKEFVADSKLTTARLYIHDKNFEKAKSKLKEIIKDFPDTRAAPKAKELLKELDDM